MKRWFWACPSMESKLPRWISVWVAKQLTVVENIKCIQHQFIPFSATLTVFFPHIYLLYTTIYNVRFYSWSHTDGGRSNTQIKWRRRYLCWLVSDQALLIVSSGQDVLHRHPLYLIVRMLCYDDGLGAGKNLLALKTTDAKQEECSIFVYQCGSSVSVKSKTY